MSDATIQKLSNQIPSQLSEDDWSQVKETIVMLNLAVAQVEFSMSDGDESIDVLTESFTSMSKGIQTISEAIASFSKHSDIDPVLQNEVIGQCDELGNGMQKAIIAFQFYDKLVQRLSHVRNSMTHLTDVIGDESKLTSADAWRKMQTDIRGAYTMEEDKQLFDAIISGQPIIEALKQIVEERANTSGADDDIELF